MSEVAKVLILNTTHITAKDDSILTCSQWAFDDYGYWVWVGYEDEAPPHTYHQGLSDSFHKCVARARALECQYLRLDRDGPIEEGLDVHNW